MQGVKVAGPQEWERLVGLGRSFENANPYGGFTSPVVQPFATIVMRLLLWAKRTTQLEYGWILVLFGVAIKILTWPFNAWSMRSMMRVQRLQPEMEAIKQKHPGDLPAQQQAMMASVFFFMMPMIYLSGFVFPIENMPGWVQTITYLIPLRYFLVIVRGIFLKGVGLDVLWPQAAALLAWGTVVLTLAALRSSKRLS